jgi:hypothetical protein
MKSIDAFLLRRCGLNIISHPWNLSSLLLIFQPEVHHHAVEAIAVMAATPTTTEVRDLFVLAVAEVHISHLIRHNLHVPSANFVGKSGTLPPGAISVLIQLLLDHLLFHISLLKPIILFLIFLRKKIGTQILVQPTTSPTICRI